MGGLSEKVAIMTGASKGIDAGIAVAWGAEGARVAVNDSCDLEGAERVAQAITDNRGGGDRGRGRRVQGRGFHLHYNVKDLGPILSVQEAIKRFGADGGSIINLSSIVGSHPVAGALL
jgi:3-oxoacyl-[acyl-carrier protein] reductase